MEKRILEWAIKINSIFSFYSPTVRIMYIMLNNLHVDTPDLSLPHSYSPFYLLH